LEHSLKTVVGRFVLDDEKPPYIGYINYIHYISYTNYSSYIICFSYIT